jgi:hypothetical protein
LGHLLESYGYIAHLPVAKIFKNRLHNRLCNAIITGVRLKINQTFLDGAAKETGKLRVAITAERKVPFCCCNCDF